MSSGQNSPLSSPTVASTGPSGANSSPDSTGVPATASESNRSGMVRTNSFWNRIKFMKGQGQGQQQQQTQQSQQSQIQLNGSSDQNGDIHVFQGGFSSRSPSAEETELGMQVGNGPSNNNGQQQQQQIESLFQGSGSERQQSNDISNSCDLTIRGLSECETSNEDDFSDIDGNNNIMSKGHQQQQLQQGTQQQGLSNYQNLNGGSTSSCPLTVQQLQNLNAQQLQGQQQDQNHSYQTSTAPSTQTVPAIKKSPSSNSVSNISCMRRISSNSKLQNLVQQQQQQQQQPLQGPTQQQFQNQQQHQQQFSNNINHVLPRGPPQIYGPPIQGYVNNGNNNMHRIPSGPTLYQPASSPIRMKSPSPERQFLNNMDPGFNLPRVHSTESLSNMNYNGPGPMRTGPQIQQQNLYYGPQIQRPSSPSPGGVQQQGTTNVSPDANQNQNFNFNFNTNSTQQQQSPSQSVDGQTNNPSNPSGNQQDFTFNEYDLLSDDDKKIKFGELLIERMTIKKFDFHEIYAHFKPLMIDKVLLGRQKVNAFVLADVLRVALQTVFHGLCFNEILIDCNHIVTDTEEREQWQNLSNEWNRVKPYFKKFLEQKVVQEFWEVKIMGDRLQTSESGTSCSTAGVSAGGLPCNNDSSPDSDLNLFQDFESLHLRYWLRIGFYLSILMMIGVFVLFSLIVIEKILTIQKRMREANLLDQMARQPRWLKGKVGDLVSGSDVDDSDDYESEDEYDPDQDDLNQHQDELYDQSHDDDDEEVEDDLDGQVRNNNNCKNRKMVKREQDRFSKVNVDNCADQDQDDEFQDSDEEKALLNSHNINQQISLSNSSSGGKNNNHSLNRRISNNGTIFSRSQSARLCKRSSMPSTSYDLSNSNSHSNSIRYRQNLNDSALFRDKMNQNGLNSDNHIKDTLINRRSSAGSCFPSHSQSALIRRSSKNMGNCSSKSSNYHSVDKNLPEDILDHDNKYNSQQDKLLMVPKLRMRSKRTSSNSKQAGPGSGAMNHNDLLLRNSISNRSRSNGSSTQTNSLNSFNSGNTNANLANMVTVDERNSYTSKDENKVNYANENVVGCVDNNKVGIESDSLSKSVSGIVSNSQTQNQTDNPNNAKTKKFPNSQYRNLLRSISNYTNRSNSRSDSQSQSQQSSQLSQSLSQSQKKNENLLDSVDGQSLGFRQISREFYNQDL